MRIIWWALCEGIICCALSHKFAKCNFEAQSIHETPSPISAEAASWCICAEQPSKLSLCCAYCMFDGAHCILHPAAFTCCTLNMMFVCWFNGIIVMANTMLTMLMHILNYSIPPFLNIQSQERCFNFIFVLNFSLFSPLSPSNGDWISKCWIKFSQN